MLWGIILLWGKVALGKQFCSGEAILLWGVSLLFPYISYFYYFPYFMYISYFYYFYFPYFLFFVFLFC
ncbi:MAG TPA: hypothetical protein P5543_09025 [Planctomycetota bacterium]|nr:hypothetical protein [Planctomycetota bacterium]HRU52321.1 hypothetical protein [Planctomycetota bacterium]